MNRIILPTSRGTTTTSLMRLPIVSNRMMLTLFAGLLVGMVVLFGLGIRTAETQTQTTYQVQDLGTLGGSSSFAYGINDSDKVVGVSSTNSGAQHAFLYDTAMHDLGTLGGSSSFAFGINDFDKVVGWSSTSSGNHAFLYDTAMHDLGTLGGSQSEADGINDSDKVVGFTETSTTSGAPRAFLYDTAMHDLGTLPGGSRSFAYGINDSDKVVGSSDTADTSPSSGNHAFLYDTAMHDLGTLGGSQSEATGINDSDNGTDKVIGWSFTGPSSGAFHAFLYDTAMHDLGTLGGIYSFALGINDSDKVVGWSYTNSGAQHAFLYDTAMHDLNDLIPQNSGWVLTDAHAINSAGKIAATGTKNGEEHALLLTPAPANGDVSNQSISAGGTVSTGSTPTAAYPVVVSLTSPVDNVVSVTTSVPTLPSTDELTVFAQQLDIEALPATIEEPIRLTLTLDRSAVPIEVDETNIQVLRDAVTIPDCTGTSGEALPDPCISERTMVDGDIQLTALTSHASQWNFGVVKYDFQGFFRPVDNPDIAVNKAKAGSAIPVKFSLGGDFGTEIFEDGYPKSSQYSCDSGDPLDSVEETVNAGGSSLSYDETTDEYTYVWKTDKLWAGQCRELVVKLDDGSEQHTAKFQLTKK